MHIEPTDQPQAGVKQVVWFNLVKKGGTPIPAAQCRCTLNLLQGPLRIQQVALTPGPNSFPSTQLIFPKPGRYTLLLEGSPLGKTLAFPAFTLRWQVNIAR